MGCDAYRTLLLTISAEARKLEDKVKKKGGRALSAVTIHLVDIVWGDERPKPPHEKVKLHSMEFAGKESSEKIQDLRKELEKKKAAGLIICTYPDLFSEIIRVASLNIGT